MFYIVSIFYFLFFISICKNQQQHLLRHPIGNFSTAYTSQTSQQQQSVYLKFGPGQQIPQQPSPQQVIQQRTIYYPCLSRCQPYRWTYRWSTSNIQPPPLQPPPALTLPVLPPAPVQPVQPQQPAQPNVHTALIRFVFPSQPNPFLSATTTTKPVSPTAMTMMTTTFSTTTMATISREVPQELLTTSTANPWSIIQQQTFPSTSSSTYELPTPPPYTQNGPGVPDTIVRLNSCPQGQPLMNDFHNPMTCNFVVKPNGGCPDQYWCHTGSSFETTTCCPNGNHKDRCRLPRSNGEGEDLIPRWYFDNGSRKCKRFLYKGMRGNANNFVTAMSCAEACETGEQAAAIRNPCAIGQPARDLNGQQFLCGISDSRCPAGYFCHLGELASNNVCCELSAGVTDRCNLAVKAGEGISHLRRFYFNTLTRKCVEYVYKGTKGNENSFLTLDECRATCEKLPNPCPMLFDFGERKECAGTEKRCGKREWCHLGSSRETTACCPAAAVNPCKLPLDLGQGVENLTRWYGVPSDDPCARECRPFQYRGMKGNQNNFLSKTECEATCKSECPIALNPCADEELLLDPEGRPQRCTANTGQCPADYWCHFGANPETTVCCSGVGRACSLPLAEGFGNALLSRWYYNAKEGTCQKFNYRGIGGNQNNYIDYEDCMNACPDSTDNIPINKQQQTSQTTILPSILTTKMPTTAESLPTPSPLPQPNPCGDGQQPLMIGEGDGERGLAIFQCSPQRLCPPTHFCHISDVAALSNQCCPKNGDPCAQLPAEGVGQSKLDRFYFDPKWRQCRAFVYRGAGGNANNFLSAADCEYVCQQSLSATNQPPPSTPNPCPRGKPFLMNNGEEEENLPMICGGNDNMEIGSNGGCPLGYWCHIGSSPETTNCCPQFGEGAKRPCELPLDLGHGRERLDRWYYDGQAQACRRFWYSGIKGNANNFLSRDQCQQQCLQLLVNQGQIGWPTSSTIEASTSISTKSKSSPQSFCLRGDPLMAMDFEVNANLMVKCGPEGGTNLDSGGCPSTHFCHLGHSQAESGCCPRTGVDRCLLPLNRGLGGTNTHIRWHFNSATRRCEAFDYAGIKGNENNFITKRHCQELCGQKAKPPKQYCPHGEPKWADEGNMLVAGEFVEKRPLTCGPAAHCPDGFVCHLSAEAGTAICCEDPAHFCLQPRDAGPCNEDKIRYGYNPLTDTCVPYRFGGCAGSLNQFETLERCTKICCRQYNRRH